MARPKPYLPIVQASRDEARLAVRLYNDSTETRSFEGFVVHMHLAWLYLLHAEFTRDGVDYRYHRTDNPRRLVKVDGEAKRWDLRKCVARQWEASTDPVRANLEFFIGLRNKIEHRYARQQKALATVLSGHAQAHLLNYENELTDQFGHDNSLATVLKFPVFIGSFTDAGVDALHNLRKNLPASLRDYIASYHAGLDEDVESDSRFELRLRVTTELAPRDPSALAIQFTRFDDLTNEERATLESMGRTGRVITRERQRPVVGAGLLKPNQVVARVAQQISFVFNMTHFTKSWKSLAVRPVTNSAHPEQTDEKYCVYDERHNDYGYTKAYVRKVVRECSTESGFRQLLGVTPREKSSAEHSV
ncbi:DUF3644 domain-containing protein [Nocardia sp. NPDC058499]|uniref:DUF3644 domain-containing protein n=1 Tax=Nocardia sp. NPDC058499 TaxID=3346530 RepID=UPI00364AC5C0